MERDPVHKGWLRRAAGLAVAMAAVGLAFVPVSSESIVNESIASKGLRASVVATSRGPLTGAFAHPSRRIRRAEGSAELRRARRCFNRTLGSSNYFRAIDVFDRRNYTLDLHQRPLKVIFEAPGGFLVVHAYTRATDRDVRAAIGFYGNAFHALAVAQEIQRKYGTDRGSHVGASAAVAWLTSPRWRDRNGIFRCLDDK
jgi:hypothetical protein